MAPFSNLASPGNAWAEMVSGHHCCHCQLWKSKKRSNTFWEPHYLDTRSNASTKDRIGGFPRVVVAQLPDHTESFFRLESVRNARLRPRSKHTARSSLREPSTNNASSARYVEPAKPLFPFLFFQRSFEKGSPSFRKPTVMRHRSSTIHFTQNHRWFAPIHMRLQREGAKKKLSVTLDPRGA